MRIHPPSGTGKPLHGRVAYVATVGGTFAHCDCSAPTFWSPSDGGNVKAGAKGESCIHSVGKIVYHLARCGWTYEDAVALANDPSMRGFLWLQCEDDPDATFERFWEGSLHAIASPLKKPAEAADGPGKAKRWRYHWSVWKTILTWVEKRIEDGEDIGRNDIVHGIAALTGWRHGVIHKYLKAGVKRGYLAFTTGKGRKRSYRVLAWPSKPRRRVLPGGRYWSHFTKAQLRAVIHGVDLTTEQIMDRYGMDLAWQDAMRDRERLRRLKALPPGFMPGYDAQGRAGAPVKEPRKIYRVDFLGNLQQPSPR